MCRLLGQSIKKSKKITVAYKCAHSEHISWSLRARVCLLVCGGVQVSQVNQANAYLIFIRSSIGRQLLNSHRMHTQCPNDYKVNNNCYAIYTNVWNSCINSWSQSRGCGSPSLCVCVVGVANAQSMERGRLSWHTLKINKIFKVISKVLPAFRNVDNKLIGVCGSQISTHTWAGNWECWGCSVKNYRK